MSIAMSTYQNLNLNRTTLVRLLFLSAFFNFDIALSTNNNVTVNIDTHCVSPVCNIPGLTHNEDFLIGIMAPFSTQFQYCPTPDSTDSHTATDPCWMHAVSCWVGTQVWLNGTIIDPIYNLQNRANFTANFLFGNTKQGAQHLSEATNVGFELLYGNIINGINHRPVHALVGTGSSGISQSINPIARLKNTVQVGWGEGSSSLSDKVAYPNFFRTHPTGLSDALAITAVVKKFEWKEVSLISDASGYGRNARNNVRKLLKGEGIITYNLGLENDVLAKHVIGNSNSLGTSSTTLTSSESTTVTASDSSSCVTQVVSLKKQYGNRIWILTSDTANSLKILDCMRLGGITAPQFLILSPDLDRDWNMYPQETRFQLEGAINVAGNEGVGTAYHENLKRFWVDYLQYDDMPHWLKSVVKDKSVFEKWKMAKFGPLIVDAVLTVMIAINKAIKRDGKKKSEIQKGVLESYVRETDFIGVSGRVLFNKEQDRDLRYDVFQV